MPSHYHDYRCLRGHTACHAGHTEYVDCCFQVKNNGFAAISPPFVMTIMSFILQSLITSYMTNIYLLWSTTIKARYSPFSTILPTHTHSHPEIYLPAILLPLLPQPNNHNHNIKYVGSVNHGPPLWNQHQTPLPVARERKGKLPPRQACRILQDALATLSYPSYGCFPYWADMLLVSARS